AHRRGADPCDGGSMSRYVFKLPDLGEGTVEAEIVAWRVKPGDEVSEDDVLAEVMTEKAAVEVPAPVSGKILSTTGQPGDMVAVGAELVVLETATGGATAEAGAGAGPGAGVVSGAGAAIAPSAGAERGMAVGNGGAAAKAEKGAQAAVGNGAARHAT